MKLKRPPLPLIIISAGFVLMVVLMNSKTPPKKKPFQIKPVLVDVINVNNRDVQYTIKSQGEVKARTNSMLVAQVSGSIINKSDKFEVGGFFKKGDLLVQIDPAEYQISVAQARARLAGDIARLAQEQARVKQAEKEWALTGRSKKDAPRLALRIPNLQEAQANVDASQAELDKALLRLKRTRIVAPFDGMVKTKSADIGQYVNSGSQIADFFATDYAQVRLPLTEKDLAFIQLPKLANSAKTRVEVEFKSRQGNQWVKRKGFIHHLEGIVDSHSRMHYAVAQIDDPYNLQGHPDFSDMEIGSFVYANISGRKAVNVISIPRSSIKGNDLVMVMTKDHKLAEKKVTIDRIQGDTVFVSAGLDNNDKVITTSLETAVIGMAVIDELPDKKTRFAKSKNQKVTVKNQNVSLAGDKESEPGLDKAQSNLQ